MHEDRSDVRDEHREEIEDISADEFAPEPCAGLAHLFIREQLTCSVEREDENDKVCEQFRDEVEDEEMRSRRIV